jgi:hypothetical protein
MSLGVVAGDLSLPSDIDRMGRVDGVASLLDSNTSKPLNFRLIKSNGWNFLALVI